MGIGPVPATAAALAKADLDLADIDLIELNEAFAAQALALMREWKFSDADPDRTNVHGSGISLGHPVGATGGRSWAPLRVNCIDAMPAMGWKPCVSTVDKDSPRSSNAWRRNHNRPERTRHPSVQTLHAGGEPPSVTPECGIAMPS